MPSLKYHYLPTTGVRADFKRLMNEFISAQTVRYEQFSQIWRKRRFSFLCAGRHSDRETREFLERAFLIAIEFFLPPYQFQVRVGGLYLLYGIFITQPIAPKVKVRLTVSQWEDTIQFQQEASDQNHLDVVYVFNKMLEEHAFQFCYTPSEMSERTLNPEREDDEVNLADDMKVEQREIDHLFNYESMEQLSYLLKHYHQMKVGMAGRKASKPDKSLDVVQGSMVEDLVSTLQSFKESCSNIYKHGTAHAEEAGTSDSGQTVLSIRQAIKSKIFGEVEVNSPVKKTDPDRYSPQKKPSVPIPAQSPSKNSSGKLKKKNKKKDIYEPYISKGKRGRPPKKLKPSMSSPHQEVSKVIDVADEDSNQEVESPHSFFSKTKQGRNRDTKSRSVDSARLNEKSAKAVRSFDIDLLPSSPNRLSGKKREISSSPSHDKLDNQQSADCGSHIDFEDVEGTIIPSKNRSKMPKNKEIVAKAKNSLREQTSTRKRKQLEKLSPDQKSPEMPRTQSKNSVIVVVDSDNDDTISSQDDEMLSNKRQGRSPANRKLMALEKKSNADNPQDEENKIGQMGQGKSKKVNSRVEVAAPKKEKTQYEALHEIEEEAAEPPKKKAKAGKGNAMVNGSTSPDSIGRNGNDTELSILEGGGQINSKTRGLSEKSDNVSRNISSKLQSSPKGIDEGVVKSIVQRKESESTDRQFVEKNSEQVKSGKNTSNTQCTKLGTQMKAEDTLPCLNQPIRRRGRPRKEGFVPTEAPGSSIKIKRPAGKAEHSAKDSAQVEPSFKNFRPEKVIENFKGNMKKTEQSTVIGSGSKLKKSNVSVAKTPLSNILSGSTTKGQAAPVKFIKIVAKTKEEAEKVLKSIEKQRASGDKLLSNLSSSWLKTISVGTPLKTNSAVNKQGTPVMTKESAVGKNKSKTGDVSEIPSSSSATDACNEKTQSRKKKEKLMYVSV